MDLSNLEAPFAAYGGVVSKPLSRFQKIVAATLTRNASAIPHVTHHDEIDITALEQYRRELCGRPISPVIFLIKAVVEALKAFPAFNSSLAEDGSTLVTKQYYHIGVAVDGPLGLLVPVLQNCDRKDVAALALELAEVSALARSKGLSMAQMSGGCFSISSLGGIGGTAFTPIVNAPEVAILGVTRTQTKPIWDGCSFVPRQMLPLSLSYDHRVINGADAARFLRHIGETLANVGSGKRD